MAEVDSFIPNNKINSKTRPNSNDNNNPADSTDRITDKYTIYNIYENDKYKTKKEFSFKNYRKIFNIASLLFLVIASLNYLVSLTGCDGTQAQCLGQLTRRYVAYFVALVVSSAFLFSLNYSFALYNFNNKIFSLLQTLIILYLCFIHDTGYNMKNHGGFNRIFFGIILFLSFFLQNILFFIIYLMRKNFLIVFISLFLVIGGFSSFVYFSLIKNCETWNKGLKNSRYDNSREVCKIKFPKFCWMNFLNGYLDISYFFLQDCSFIRMDSKSQLEKWLKNPSAKVLGYPRTEQKKFFPDSMLEEFQFRVLSEIIDMEDPSISQDIKDKVEAIIDFNVPKPNIELRIANDEQLKKARKTIFESNFKQGYEPSQITDKRTKSDIIGAKNVIHFFIDSLSRDDFKRKLPKTKLFFERFYDNHISAAQVFQFFKFHAVSHFTYGNLLPTQFGLDYQHKGNEAPILYLKYFKEKGFITGQGHGYCGREIIDIERGQEHFIYDNFDHEINPIFCDPNFTVPGNPYGIFNGVFSYKRRCLYGKDTHEYIFEYAKLFWKNYKNEPKFFRLGFQDAHEGTGEVVKYMDDRIVAFFEFLEKENSLEDTVILLHSDHGVNMPGFYTLIDSEDFFIEKTLPALFLFTPQKIAQNFKKQLKEKENMFVTPYDIHSTFLHLAQAPVEAFNKIGASFFEDMDETGRNCTMFKVRDPYCNCVGEGNRNVE